MPAPKKNQFWKLRDESGRKKLFETPELFFEKAIEYFKWADENPIIKTDAVRGGQNAGDILEIPIQRPYSIEALCIYLGITYQTFKNYEKNENYKDFFEVFAYVKQIIENNQFDGATVGTYNANIIARKLGLADKSEVTSDQNINLNGVKKVSFVDDSVDEKEIEK